MLPLDASQLEVVWTVLGRVPAAMVLAALTWRVARGAGGGAHAWRDALLGLSGFTAGALVGTALVPSVLGALGGGTLGALLTWWAIGAKAPDLSVGAPLLVGLMALGRWGCVLSGCCFGRVTDGPWGLTYGPVSLAHVLHAQLGLVHAGEPALPVIPVPALESLGLLVVLATWWPLRRRLRPPVAAMVLISETLVLRAGLDPLRAMVNTTSSRWPLGPLSVFQWLALGLAVASLLFAWRLQRGVVVPWQARSRAPVALVWAAQVSLAVAAEPRGTWLLRVFALAASAGSLAAVLLVAEREARLRPALALGALALLMPLMTRAGRGDEPLVERRRWLVQVDPQTQTLVPSAPPLLSAEAPEALDAGVSVAEAEAPATPRAPARRLTVSGLGGLQGYYFSTCGGGTSVSAGYGDLGAQLEWDTERQNVVMLRARLLGVGNESALLGSTVVSGFYEFRWERVSLGAGGSVSGSLGPVTSLVAPQAFPWALTPMVTLGAWPLLYLRLEPLRGAAFELGTGSRFQPQDGVFLGLRFGTDSPDGFSGRLGFESTWLPHPIVSTNAFGELAFPAGPGRLHVRLLGHPAPGAAFSGGLRWSFAF